MLANGPANERAEIEVKKVAKAPTRFRAKFAAIGLRRAEKTELHQDLDSVSLPPGFQPHNIQTVSASTPSTDGT